MDSRWYSLFCKKFAFTNSVHYHRPHMDIPALLKRHGLRDTQSRRLVLKVLMGTKKPLTHREIHARVRKSHATVNLVTIYRMLETFEELGLIHRHLRSGGVFLCSLPEEEGHHVLLSCDDCGRVEECCDTTLCKYEDLIARRAGFAPKSHRSEVVGLCSSCK